MLGAVSQPTQCPHIASGEGMLRGLRRMRPAGRCAYADDHRRRVDQRATATGQTSRSAQPKRGGKRAFADGSVTGDGEDPETERIEAKINAVAAFHPSPGEVRSEPRQHRVLVRRHGLQFDVG